MLTSHTSRAVVVGCGGDRPPSATRSSADWDAGGGHEEGRRTQQQREASNRLARPGRLCHHPIEVPAVIVAGGASARHRDPGLERPAGAVLQLGIDEPPTIGRGFDLPLEAAGRAGRTEGPDLDLSGAAGHRPLGREVDAALQTCGGVASVVGDDVLALGSRPVSLARRTPARLTRRAIPSGTPLMAGGAHRRGR